MVKKIKKVIDTKTKGSKEEEKDLDEDKEPEKEGGTLSDGVLDAFDEEVPVVDPLEEESLSEDDDDDFNSDEDEW